MALRIVSYHIITWCHNAEHDTNLHGRDNLKIRNALKQGDSKAMERHMS